MNPVVVVVVVDNDDVLILIVIIVIVVNFGHTIDNVIVVIDGVLPRMTAVDPVKKPDCRVWTCIVYTTGRATVA